MTYQIAICRRVEGSTTSRQFPRTRTAPALTNHACRRSDHLRARRARPWPPLPQMCSAASRSPFISNAVSLEQKRPVACSRRDPKQQCAVDLTSREISDGEAGCLFRSHLETLFQTRPNKAPCFCFRHFPLRSSQLHTAVRDLLRAAEETYCVNEKRPIA